MGRTEIPAQHPWVSGGLRDRICSGGVDIQSACIVLGEPPAEPDAPARPDAHEWRSRSAALRRGAGVHGLTQSDR
jgi:hypothetical protein